MTAPTTPPGLRRYLHRSTWSNPFDERDRSELGLTWLLPKKSTDADLGRAYFKTI